MTTWAREKGKSRPKAGFLPPNIPFFPFVSVLISTMGVLILLVIVIGQRARLAANRRVEAERLHVTEELRSALELLTWERDTLKESLRLGREKVQDLHLELGHLEDHFRRLKARGQQLVDYFQGIARGSSPSADVDSLRGQIAEVNRKINELSQAIEALRRQQGKRYYSIIPYAGPFGTPRWPVYIECRQDAIIIQPEGIRLIPEDFQSDPGVDNLLAVSLRAIREFWSRNRIAEGEPYPLLLVRPSGIAAFYVARAALETWNGEFGYELIEEDWELVYPPANPELGRQLAAVVEDSRARARAVAAIAPRRLATSPRRFVLSPDRGGLVPEIGSALGQVPPSTGKEDIGPGQGGSAADTTSARPGKTEFGSPAGAGLVGQPPALPGTGMPGPLAAGPRGLLDQQTPPGLQDDPGSLGQLPAADKPSSSGGGTSTQSLAEIRGANWALPASVRMLVPLTRPVRLLCSSDLLVIQPEAGLGSPIVIPWEDPPEKTIDTLVRRLWEYVETWGPAGRGMAWRPVLRVKVTEGGDRRFEQLKGLLEGSGLRIDAE